MSRGLSARAAFLRGLSPSLPSCAELWATVVSSRSLRVFRSCSKSLRPRSRGGASRDLPASSNSWLSSRPRGAAGASTSSPYPWSQSCTIVSSYIWYLASCSSTWGSATTWSSSPTIPASYRDTSVSYSASSLTWGMLEEAAALYWRRSWLGCWDLLARPCTTLLDTSLRPAAPA